MSARQLITSWKTWLCRSVFFFLFFFPPRFYNPPCVLLKRPCAHSRRETLMRSGAFASLLPQPSVCRLPAAAGNNAASVPAQRWRVHRSEPSNKPHILYFFALNCTLYNPHYPPHPHASPSQNTSELIADFPSRPLHLAILLLRQPRKWSFAVKYYCMRPCWAPGESRFSRREVH